MQSSRPNIGLALTGGGARAAYQVGVLRAVSEILGAACVTSPFQTITGISAGAINAAFLGAQAHCFPEGVRAAHELWRGLQADKILRTDTLSLSRLAIRWMRDLSFGGLASGGGRSTYLLDTQPLRELLQKEIDFDAISRNSGQGVLHGTAVTATNYRTGTAITFFDGSPEIEPWSRSSRLGQRTRLTLEHVLASASIPILFQPVKIGDSFYGDGSIRMRAPLSPPIHLGADRILAIGIRYLRPEELTLAINERNEMKEITVADIAGTMLNAAFMDSVDSDAERLERINQTVALLSEERRRRHPSHLRRLPLLVIRPSRDLGSLAAEQFDRFPGMLRYLLKGIGASREKGWDLLSYLAFDRTYTTRLLELGHSDAMARAEQIREFLTSSA